MVLVIVTQDREYSGDSYNCFELRKIRHVAPSPDAPTSRQVYVQQQLLKKSWMLSKRMKIKMPQLLTASEPTEPVGEINQTSPLHPSAPTPPSLQTQPKCQNHDDESCDIIRALDKKRKQLDDQIANYIGERNEDYRRFETELRSKKGLGAVNLSKPGAKSERAGDRDSHVLRVDAPQTRAEATRRSVHETVLARNRQSDAASLTSSTQSSADCTPAHDREKEFRGLFTPSYLPLLDSRNYRPDAPRRTSSAPDLASEVGDNSAALQAEAVIKKIPSPSLSGTPASLPKLPRTRSSPLAENLQPPSALKPPRKVSRSKKVSFNIDNEILAPADTVKEYSSPPSDAVTRSSPATQPAVSPFLPLSPSDNSVAAKDPPEISVLESSQSSSAEVRLVPAFRNYSVDGSSQASPQNPNGEISTLPAVMSSRRNFSGSGNGKSKQLSSIYEDEDLMFGLDGDGDEAEAKTPAHVPTPMSSPDRPSGSVQGNSSSAMGQSRPAAYVTSGSSDDQPSPAVSGNTLRRQSATQEQYQRPQPLSALQSGADDSASASVSPPMPIRGSRHRRNSSTYAPISPISSPARTALPPSHPNFASFVRDDPNFSTFVGGIRGESGIDPSDRSSYGYPPSLGESYMEQNFRRRSNEAVGLSNSAAARTRRKSNAGGETKEADGEYQIDESKNVEDEE